MLFACIQKETCEEALTCFITSDTCFLITWRGCKHTQTLRCTQSAWIYIQKKTNTHARTHTHTHSHSTNKQTQKIRARSLKLCSIHVDHCGHVARIINRPWCRTLRLSSNDFCRVGLGLLNTIGQRSLNVYLYMLCQGPEHLRGQ